MMENTDERTGGSLRVGDVDLWVHGLGDADAPAILLINGAHSPLDWWEDELCQALVDAGRRVIRYDHRDTGQSVAYAPGAPGYGFDELVGDAVGVLDAAGVERAHLVGISLGGGIAQRVALEHPDRVASLTLIATSPGLRPASPPAADLPPMLPALAQHFMTPSAPPDWSDPSAVADRIVATQRRLAGDEGFDEERTAQLAAQIVDRSTNIAATLANHACIAPGDPYRDRLGAIATPTLVIHGTADPLFPLGHGQALSQEIPGATLLPLEGVGHQVPPRSHWDVVTSALLAHTDPPV